MIPIKTKNKEIRQKLVMRETLHMLNSSFAKARSSTKNDYFFLPCLTQGEFRGKRKTFYPMEQPAIFLSSLLFSFLFEPFFIVLDLTLFKFVYVTCAFRRSNTSTTQASQSHAARKESWNSRPLFRAYTTCCCSSKYRAESRSPSREIGKYSIYRDLNANDRNRKKKNKNSGVQCAHYARGYSSKNPRCYFSLTAN